jgi:hypothetical protein
MMMYSHERWAEMIEEKFDAIRKLATLKGGEYSGDEDRLNNFRRNGLDLGLPMETIWRIYAAKHWDAIGQYVKDLHSNKERTRLEPIAGRVDDLLVYLLLFAAMIEEREGGVDKAEVPLSPGTGSPEPSVSLAKTLYGDGGFVEEEGYDPEPVVPRYSKQRRRLRKPRED